MAISRAAGPDGARNTRGTISSPARQHNTTKRGRDRFPGRGLVTLTQRRSQQRHQQSGGHVHVVLDRGAASLEAGDGDAERGA